MKISIIPLANWEVGTALIIFFGILCVALAAIVLSFVFRSKKNDDEEINSSED